ncbi:MAG: hypothetical protein EHM60_12605 [Lysobacterales bacterium]|nr:MAG: hypothetical protein EHM60_12605 [Xanthomonadales bacterium]
MQDVLILGPQFRAPNLRTALAKAGLGGPAVAITAGWQEREGELGALEEHLAAPVVDLRLYERAEAVFVQDPELHAACRARQGELRRMQELYRARLDHAKAAAREMLALEDDSAPARRARRSAIGALRRLDAEHLRDLEAMHARFDESWSPDRRPLLAGQRHDLASMIAAAAVVFVAGGHVAVLLNRMRLFGLGPVLRTRPVVAWSAGAMALSERVVLFHDRPPQGAGNAELFETGFGLVRDVVFLPHASSRLALQDPRRIGLMSRRFAPGHCYTLDDGDELHWHRGRLRTASGARRLTRSGGVLPAGVAA